jgi:hypothetical protein
MIAREINYVDALLSLAPGACWSSDGTLEGLDWIDKNIERPTNKAIRAEVSRLAEQQKANAYRVARSGKYPPIGDQLDALYHAGVFPPEMEAQITAVKEQYPKPTAQ